MRTCGTMELSEVKARSHPRHNARVSVDLRTICLKVKYSPGHTAHWHYGSSLARGQYYAAFARAVKYGLIKGDATSALYTVYYLTDRGNKFIEMSQ